MLVSPPARGAWIEMIGGVLALFADAVSPPARGAWIEMSEYLPRRSARRVAPRTGGVD